MQSSFPPPDYQGYADYHDQYDNFEEDNHVPLPSEPKTNVNFEDPEIAALPRILLMGPRRSGKTSIQVSAGHLCALCTHTCVFFVAKDCVPQHSPLLSQRVVFHKMSPHETLFRLEATQGLERAVVDHTPLCRFTIWDFPGDYFYEKEHFQGSLIYVLDAQDEPYDHVLQSFTNAVTHLLEYNPNCAIEVFIHKVDGELFLSDETKYDCRRDIVAQVSEELADAGVDPNAIQIRYHLTSIYDHSIYEALSRVIQKLIPQLPTLENLLNVLVNTCSMEKAYLFDVVSKLYISTDSSPVDMQSVELCSDMIDVVLDVSGIYGLGPSDDEAYDNASASVIRLSNGMVRYVWNDLCFGCSGNIVVLFSYSIHSSGPVFEGSRSNVGLGVHYAI
jgi:Ras-related GTP-binding protein C/D